LEYRAERQVADSKAGTVFSGSNKKYVSTGLMKEEAVKEGYFSSVIQLLDYSAVKMV